MRKSKFSKEQIAQALTEYESGRKSKDICGELGIARVTLYAWKKKYSSTVRDQLTKLKELGELNSVLKQMRTDVAQDIKILKNVLSKK